MDQDQEKKPEPRKITIEIDEYEVQQLLLGANFFAYCVACYLQRKPVDLSPWLPFMQVDTNAVLLMDTAKRLGKKIGLLDENGNPVNQGSPLITKKPIIIGVG